MTRHRGRHRATATHPATATHHSVLRMRPITHRRRVLDGLRALLAGTRPGW
ncbi:hypothetical protein WIS52_31085 [Pseudonocardia nematodicida]|uniref:Uncharacterized protein n=1 Tax=Pseudonocardia nematodicida TaxID=1206997 RepID=A0ABV1KM43_9PSEU